jgi:4-diphosphocytidyl-2-C-methyl-D-erythritol kinase
MRGLAHAKINLTLEVVGKRPDGYHELVSIMQTVALADTMELVPATDLHLTCNVPALSGDDNLVVKAARLLGKPGHFRLEKHIPAAAGLGGGSSDAALALRLVDAVYDVRLPLGELLEAAAELGSAVPCFLHGGTALIEGRGERVTPLPDLPCRWLVLLNPGVPLSTAAVFKELRPAEYSDGAVSRRWADALAPNLGPATDPRLANGAQPADAAHGWTQEQTGGTALPLVNTLDAAARRLEPAIRLCHDRLLEAGATEVLLSGSGPTVFGLATDEHQARLIAEATGGVATRFASRPEARG